MFNSLLPILLLLILYLAAAAAAEPSAYEVLRTNGLPIGLLPKGVKDFAIDAGGNFQARLDGPCTATFESEVLYNATIAGTISLGQIAGLSGVTAQDLFLWFPVLAIRLDNYTSGIIHFDVGVVDKRYPLSLFEVPPDCAAVSPPQTAGMFSDIAAVVHLPQNQLSNLGNEIYRDHIQKAAF